MAVRIASKFVHPRLPSDRIPLKSPKCARIVFQDVTVIKRSVTTKQDENRVSIVSKRNSDSSDTLTEINNKIKVWNPLHSVSIGISSITRLVGSLNIEIPKIYNIYTPNKQAKPVSVDTQDKTEKNSTETIQKMPEPVMEIKKKSVDVVPKEYLTEHVQETLDDNDSSNRKEFRDSLTTIKQSEPESPPISESTAMQDNKVSNNIYLSDNYMGALGIENFLGEERESTTPCDATNTPGKPAPSSLKHVTQKDNSGIFEQLKGWMPGRGSSSTLQSEESLKIVKKPRVETVSRTALEKRTRALIQQMKTAQSPVSKFLRTEDFCKHMTKFPDAKGLAVKNGALAALLKLKTKTKDINVQEQANIGLALIGYVPPVNRRGVCLLSLDGGGTKGLMTIEMLRRIESQTGRPIADSFDYICGVSTGSLIACMVGLLRLSLDHCEAVYKEFSREMFARNKLIGTGKLFLSHAYYDSALWEDILKNNLGHDLYYETTMNPNVPKLASVSTLVNSAIMKSYLFRNYTYPVKQYSHYPGSMTDHIWQGVRASSSAPGYFEDFVHGNAVHQDGGILTNNPTAIGLHEAKLLWPNYKIQCVISLGTGKFRPAEEDLDFDHTSLKSKVLKFIDSATDTEAVHHTLQTLLPPTSYFRFNPYLSNDLLLDEIRQEMWDQMEQDVEMYCRKNFHKFEAAARQLNLKKMPHQIVFDWINFKRDQME